MKKELSAALSMFCTDYCSELLAANSPAKNQARVNHTRETQGRAEGGRVQKELCGRLRHAVELIDLGARLASKKSKSKGLGGSADEPCGAPQRCGSSNRPRW